MARDEFQVNLNCPHCHALGVAMWEENSLVNPRGPQARLVRVAGDFHSELGRTLSGDPLIVCDKCDAIQAD